MKPFTKLRDLLSRPFTVMIILVALTAIAWIAFREASIQNELDKEFLKALPQAGLVAVAGALLSFMADSFQRKQERIRLREDFFKDVMKRITASYNKSKGARRMVRARGLMPPDSPTHVRLEAYDDCMETLNEAQLEIEAAKKDLESSMADLPNDAPLRKNVEFMEGYLNQIIREYENVRLKPVDRETRIALTEVGQFKTFAAKKERKPDEPLVEIESFKEYANRHGDIRKAINGQLLALTPKTHR